MPAAQLTEARGQRTLRTVVPMNYLDVIRFGETGKCVVLLQVLARAMP